MTYLFYFKKYLRKNNCIGIRSKINGLVVPVKDATALAIQMTRLVENSDLHHKLKNASRAPIVERYSQEELWKAILEEYNFSLSSVK